MRNCADLQVAESIRNSVYNIFTEEIPVALSYHRGDHGEDHPLWVLCVIDIREIRYAFGNTLGTVIELSQLPHKDRM